MKAAGTLGNVSNSPPAEAEGAEAEGAEAEVAEAEGADADVEG